jgi:hypothetical protein
MEPEQQGPEGEEAREVGEELPAEELPAQELPSAPEEDELPLRERMKKIAGI